MKNLHKLLYLVPLAFAFSCEPEFDDLPAPSGGSADFTNYVAVGNSLTAGYQSNALSADGQLNSFPAILSAQMKLAGGGEHKVPLLTGDYGSRGAGLDLLAQNLIVPELKLDYSADCKGEVSLGPTLDGSPYGSAQGFFTSNATPGPYNNYGVPGAKSFHLLAPGYGNAANLPSAANPYYVRFANPADNNESVIAAAASANPTFFSLWIGNNDVLGYATGGGEESGEQPTPVAGAPGVGFEQTYLALVANLTANGANGVLTNIPDITSIPFFNTIPTGTELTQAQVDALNAAYAPYNGAMDQAAAGGLIGPNEANLRKINFTVGQNPWVVIDNGLGSVPDGQGGTLPKMRLLRSGELMALRTPQDSLKCAGWGTQKPIPANFVLDRNEITKISNAVSSYNAIIKKAADDNGLAYVDANAILKEMESGLSFNGVTYSTEFVSGGAFSLDGVHPNTRGYAIIANAHIDAINAKYGSSIPKVNVNQYEGIVFP